jgi:hypothetical protein
MSDTMTDEAGGGGPPETLDAPALFADPLPPTASPLIMTDAYVELNGVNLRCLTNHVELTPDNKLVTVTTFCSETDYPGVTKWHLKMKLYQSFDAGATDSVLSAALAAYQASATPMTYKVRPKSSQPVGSTNPEFAGVVIPQPYTIFGGDAGTASEVDIDWNMTAPPTRNVGSVAATGATAGAPGFYTPPGAVTPANLAALTGVTASPVAAWAVGQFVLTADLLGAHWSGSAWVAGKA